MQNNVTDLSHKLQRSLDNNYNVIDMPAVIEIISTLEKTAVTKELLETTRLGKYINELRRRTSNESLAKRAKDLVKRWRDLILAEANGQVKTVAATPPPVTPHSDCPTSPDTGQTQVRKRPARMLDPSVNHLAAKRPLLNGQTRELDLSDNSNCSVKDLKKTDVIFINSDSNSSIPDTRLPNETTETVGGSETTPSSGPKKRGRKKGSKNHKNLVIAAEESFSNKMAVSRNSKVKTTQELLADLQSRTGSKQSQDIELRAAQLTESLSRIDQKLNPQKQINKNVTPIRQGTANSWQKETVSEVVVVQSDEEIVDVVGTDAPDETDAPKDEVQPLTVSALLSQLPPVDASCLNEPDPMPSCQCASLDDDTSDAPVCPTWTYLSDVYHLQDPVDAKADLLHSRCLLNVNGNFGIRSAEADETETNLLHSRCLPNGNFDIRSQEDETADDGLYLNIVPNMSGQRLGKDLSHERAADENFQKYSISIAEDGSEVDARTKESVEFREWHETLDVSSYNGETLRVLPYVVID